MPKKNFWYCEPASIYEDVRICHLVKEKLFSKRSRFQKIEIFDSAAFGKALAIDGLVQATQADEFIYHEMICHVPLFLHKDPKKILIVGGGDGGALREVLKHPVEEVVMVEIDEEVVKACRKFLPEISKGSFDDPRTKLVIGDGFDLIRKNPNSFDLIIVDSCDPHGPAEKLFGGKFYKNVSAALHEGGLAVYQSGFTFIQKEVLKKIVAQNRKYFPWTGMFLAPIPSYGGGSYAFTMSSKKKDGGTIDPAELEKKIGQLDLGTRYYDPKMHLASFVLPNYLKAYLKLL